MTLEKEKYLLLESDTDKNMIDNRATYHIQEKSFSFYKQILQDFLFLFKEHDNNFTKSLENVRKYFFNKLKKLIIFKVIT